MTIGDRLKLVRNEAKLSLEKAGAIFYITAQTLSRYENGTRTPDNDFLRDFGKHFKLSGDWLLYGEPPIRKGDNLDKNIKESFFELTHLINAKKVPDVGLPEKLGESLERVAQDLPENYLIMFEYMMKYASVRKNMFQFFFLFQKPMIDEQIKFLEKGQ
jgi:transcriptional regulator with XRE-family HTH domain